MTRHAKTEVFTTVVIALLLVLTSWGNALALLVAAVVALLVGMILFGRDLRSGRLLACGVGCALAIVIALVIWQR